MTTLSTHSHFDDELGKLKESLLGMGQAAMDMVDNSTQGFRDEDEDRLKAVLEIEKTVNRLHVEIDDRCVKLLALHQPMAVDLRFITAAMKANADLERIGDQSVNIAQTCLEHLFKGEEVSHKDIIVRMGDLSHRMLKDAMIAFDAKDVELARSVMAQDEQEDRLKRETLTDLIALIPKDPSRSAQFVELILLSKNFERVGDHATNIAENVVFMTLGKDIRHRLKGDFVLTPVRRADPEVRPDRNE